MRPIGSRPSPEPGPAAEPAPFEASFGPIGDVEPDAWARLAPAGDPFLSHAFLAALEHTRCTGPETGWAPFHLRLNDGQGTLVGAAPAYVKSHSHGEFIYDWRWAAAYEQAGGRYYPKLFVGPPFTPASGPRLLGEVPEVVIQALLQATRSSGLSSVHFGSVADGDRQRLEASGFLCRALWQYHWHNRGYRDFADFLEVLKRKRRKNIRAERRRIAEAGWAFRRVGGAAADGDDWDLMHRLYEKTFVEKGNWPTLNRAFFSALRQGLAERVWFVFAQRDGETIAGAFFFRSETTLYGRYWGALEEHKFLHFETCYYQGIELAIALGLDRFEPGAQGTHKIPRGFEPVEVWCAHHFADPRLHAAIDASLEHERYWHDEEGRRLATLSAYP